MSQGEGGRYGENPAGPHEPRTYPPYSAGGYGNPGAPASGAGAGPGGQYPGGQYQGGQYGSGAYGGGPEPAGSGLPTCPRHPGVVSYVRCQRCGRPTCPQCQRPAAVGIQCVDCVAQSQARTRVPRTVAGAKIRGGRPTVTYTLIGLNVAAFLLQLLWPPLQSLGLFVPVLAEPEPWRFLTSAFLHAGMWHIVFNMYALYVVGPTLEAVLGRARFLTLYLLSALGGSVAILVLADPSSASWFTPVVGASGAVFGLFGALALTMRRLKRSDSQILVVIALNVLIGFVVPGISWQGHLGGLVVGALVAAIYLFAPKKHRNWTAVAGSVLVLVALVVLAISQF